MDLYAIRVAVKTILQDGMPEWNCYEYLIDQFSPPALFVCDPQNWKYDEDFNDGVSFTLNVRIAVGRDNEEEAHKLISQMISTGPGTIKELIESNPTLNGTVDSVSVPRLGRMARYRSGGNASYLGIEFELDIMAS